MASKSCGIYVELYGYGDGILLPYQPFVNAAVNPG